MDFRHPDGRHLPVLLPARSAMIMTGEARYVWTHGITPRKSDVINVTSRKPDVINVTSRKNDVINMTSRKSDDINVTSSKNDVIDKTSCETDVINVASDESDVINEDAAVTLAYRETRTSFTFRTLRRKPCDCSEYGKTSNLEIVVRGKI